MNFKLMEEIIKHVYSNLGIIDPTSINMVNWNKSNSILSNDFKLIEKYSLLFDDGTSEDKNIWGCEFSNTENKLTLLVTDCSTSSIKEYALLIKLDDSPAYGCYLIYDDNHCPMIAFNITDNKWYACSTYLQSNFLSGMEQIRELNLVPKKTKATEDLINLFKSFLSFYDQYYEILLKEEDNER